jgi:hypothetical protein
MISSTRISTSPDLKAKNAAILTDSGATSQEIAPTIKEHLAARGVALTGEQQYQSRTRI